MTNITYFHSVVRDAYSASSSSVGEETTETLPLHHAVQPGPAIEVVCNGVKTGYLSESEGDGGYDLSSCSSSTSFNFKRFYFDELETPTSITFNHDQFLSTYNADRVYRGWIYKVNLDTTQPGKKIAVDIVLLDRREQFRGVAKIQYLSQLSHPNLVKLVGYSLLNKDQLVVYEGMPDNLESKLFCENNSAFSWGLRMKVALGVSKGLAFLHRAHVIYGNFRTSHVQLDKDYNAKLSGFRIAGYDSPVSRSCPLTGHLLSDVYSFGVLLHEILSGRGHESRSGQIGHVKWDEPYIEPKILHILDPNLKGRCSLASAQKLAKLTLKCLAKEAKLRPNMDEVIRELELLQDSRDMRFARNEEVAVTELGYFPLWQDMETTENDPEFEYFQLSEETETTDDEQGPEYSLDFDDIEDLREQEQEFWAELIMDLIREL